MKIKTKNVIEVSDWDEMVSKTYGRPYSYQQQDGCRDRGVVDIVVPDEAQDYENDSVPEIVNHAEMGVAFAAWLKRSPKAKVGDASQGWSIKLWWQRNFYPDLQMVANDLHAKGLLKRGEYTINIDW